MSKNSVEREKVEMIKEVLRRIHRGESVEEVKARFRDVLEKVSPFEIPLIEQELVREGVKVNEILKLCDLHVELFREFFESRELRGVPRGHPLHMLLKENEHLAKQAEAVRIYAQAILESKSREEQVRLLEELRSQVEELSKVRIHYRKVQMLIFPYLERRGINAVPRVMWGREDQVIVKIRELKRLIADATRDPEKHAGEAAEKAREASGEVLDLIFRENKILYPAVWTLFSEGEWAAIWEIAGDIGYIVEAEEGWKPKTKPLMPYEIDAVITPDKAEKLPPEFRSMALAALTPDKYRVRGEDDIEFETGFLSREEAEALFKALPVEVTFANSEDRVKFYTQNMFHRGFVRTKTILGRKIEFCHPPRLEQLVKTNVEKLKRGEMDYREFWTRMGDRILRVLIVAVRNDRGEYVGTLEVVEDLTDIVRSPERVLEEIVVI